MILSLIIFLFCCVTDYLDGYYARAYKQITKLGQILDPLADKILISVSLLFIVGFGLVGRFSTIPASIILCREIIISGVRDGIIASRRKFSTSTLAKWKTSTQMTAIILVLVAEVIGSADIRWFGEMTLWASSVIATISGIMYCKDHISL
jgi:cardiolipin synthase